MTADDVHEHEPYLEASGHLCSGRAQEALELLEGVPEPARDRRYRLLLGKAYLELARAGDAAECFRTLLSSPSRDTGEHAYLRILLAAAIAGTGGSEEAFGLLDAVPATDARLERAARALRKRIEAGAPPLVRL